jgi:hypothetical protein
VRAPEAKRAVLKRLPVPKSRTAGQLYQPAPRLLINK